MSKFKKAVLGWLGEKFCQPARIVSIKVVSEHFRLIHIESPSFSKMKWKAGDKIQINTGDWDVRTYTPIAHDSTLAQIQLLVFVHGNGPGAFWAKNLKKGDLCDVFGPSSSLSLRESEMPQVLFGDETSFAVAAAFKNFYGSAADLSWIFEVNSVEESKHVCEQIGILQNATFVEKQSTTEHLAEVLKKLRSRLDVARHTDLFLTGNAKSIQWIRNQIRELNHANTRTVMKAYWSKGKVGMD